jgi:hypothetical protein
LLDEARAARDAGNLIEPAGDNAVELYLSTLEEASGDPDIAAELDDVLSQVLGLAEAAILQQNAADAIDALSMVRMADPDNPRLTFLDAQLTQLQLRVTVDEARIGGRHRIGGSEFVVAGIVCGAPAAADRKCIGNGERTIGCRRPAVTSQRQCPLLLRTRARR